MGIDLLPFFHALDPIERIRQKLHQPHRAGGRFGIRVKSAFGPDHGEDQCL